jgi:hypothetical protein
MTSFTRTPDCLCPTFRDLLHAKKKNAAKNLSVETRAIYTHSCRVVPLRSSPLPEAFIYVQLEKSLGEAFHPTLQYPQQFKQKRSEETSTHVQALIATLPSAAAQQH